MAISVCYKGSFEAEEMTQWLRALAALGEVPGSVPSTHIGWLPTGCNFRSRNIRYLWPL